MASLKVVKYRGGLALPCRGAAHVERAAAALAAQVAPARREAVVKRDGPGSLHITVVAPQESTAELESLLEGIEVPERELCVLGLGSGPACSFAVVHCSRLQHARLSAGLPAHDFHITLGFEGKDQHDVNKGLRCLAAWHPDGGSLASCLEHDSAAIRDLACKPSAKARLMNTVQQVAHLASQQELYAAGHRKQLLELSLKSAFLCNLDSAVTDALGAELAEYDPVSALALATKFALKKGVLAGRAGADHVHAALRDLPRPTAFGGSLAWLAQEAREAAVAEDCMWGSDDAGNLALLKLPLNCAPVPGTEDKLWGSGCPSKGSLRAVMQLGLARVVSLTEAPLSCRGDSKDFARLQFHHFPIRDRHAPDTLKDLLLVCRCVQHGLAQARAERGGVLVHCLGGKGRTVMVLAAVLMLEEGLSPSAALARVKANRNTCVTEEQVRMLKQLYGASSVRAMGPLSGSPAGALPKALPRVLVLCGLPGAGKSTFCQELLRQFPASVRHINQDELGGKETEVAWSAAAMSAANGDPIVAILDKCNLKQADRRAALGSLDAASRPRAVLVHFSLGADDCAERAAARVDHVGEVTGERAQRIVKKMAGTLEAPESAKAEGVGALHTVHGDDEVAALLQRWGCAAEAEQEERRSVVCFPRTRHLKNLGAATDDDVHVEDASPFLARRGEGDYVTVEEKIDGANLGIRLGDDGYKIVAQNRSHVVHSKYHQQFEKLDKWIQDHAAVLRQLLRDQNQILYGEWVYALHSTSYDRLPGYFVAFDLRCVLTDTFVARGELQAMLRGTGIPMTPLLLSRPAAGSAPEARAMMKEILDLVHRKSAFARDFQAEGVYVRIQSERLILDRAKIVRPHFIAGNERWDRGIITVNGLQARAADAEEAQDAQDAWQGGAEASPAQDRPADGAAADEAVADEAPPAEAAPEEAAADAAGSPEGAGPEVAAAAPPEMSQRPPPELHRTISRHREVLRWLAEQLAAALGESEAESLATGVEMILSGDEEAPLEDVADLVAEMLQGEQVPEEIVSEFAARVRNL